MGVLVGAEPLYDGLAIGTLLEAGAHGQLLSNLTLKLNRSSQLVVLPFVALDLPDEVTLADAQLLAPLEDAHVESLHPASELLQLLLEVDHIVRRLPVLPEFTLQLLDPRVDCLLLVGLGFLEFVLDAVLRGFSVTSNIHFKKLYKIIENG